MTDVNTATREALPRAWPMALPMARVKELPWRLALIAALGGFLTIGALAMVNATGELALLIPPFGASCVLVFGAPASPFARPRNVIGGHVISAAMGLCAVLAFGAGPLGIAAGVGLAIAAMILTDTVHPPAGANPIVVAMAHAGWMFLATPILAGAVAIVVAAALYNGAVARVKTSRP